MLSAYKEIIGWSEEVPYNELMNYTGLLPLLRFKCSGATATKI